MSGVRRFTLPAHSLSLVVGDGFKLSKKNKIGYIASLNYRRGFKIREEKRRVFEADPSEPSGVGHFERPGRGRPDPKTSAGVCPGRRELGTRQEPTAYPFSVSTLSWQTSTPRPSTAIGVGTTPTLHSTRLKFVSRALNVLQLVWAERSRSGYSQHLGLEPVLFRCPAR